MIVKKMKDDQGQVILAAIDDELKGKRFEEGERQLDLASEFYNGKKTSDEDFKILLTEAYIVNAAGEKTIGLLIDNGLISSKNILRVDGIPHVQIVMGN